MKFKTSKKNITNGYSHILGTGYCSMQWLLHYKNPIAYSTRVEGWACDYYEINNVLISTGYSPVNSKNVNRNYETITEYDKKAKEIICSNIEYETKKQKVEELLNEFIKTL